MAKTEAIRDQAMPLDPTVRALGVVSLLNDFSSEVAVRTLPLFLANVLGVKIGIIGLIEGIAESTATLLKLLSGYLSDRSGRKKALALWGYGFSNLTKPLLYFATSWGLVLAVRFLDRVGKGIRTAPRDALIADITPPGLRGRAFGFNKAMDKAGGFLGLIVAAGALHLTQQDTITLTRESYEWLVLLAVLPGFAAVGVMAWWVEERPKAPVKSFPVLIWSEMNGRFWTALGLVRPLGTIPLRSRARSSGYNRFAHDSTTAVIRRARHRQVQIVQIVQPLRSVQNVNSSRTISPIRG